MEERVRRFLSWLWLLQAAVFPLLGYVPRISGLNCYCYNEPNDGFPLCFWEGDSCTGDLCYVHRELRNGVFYTTWNCLRKGEHFIQRICDDGAFNTDTEAYVCCKDRDNCNEGVQIELPIERPTTTPLVITTIEESGSGSGSELQPPRTTQQSETTVPPSTTSTTLSILPTRAISTDQPLNTSLKCFCSSCPSGEDSCGPNSSCYVGKDFKPRRGIYGAAASSPESYSWGCFNESEAMTKCQQTDKYRCCSDRDKCNERLDPPPLKSPLKCFCTSCPDGQDYVSCGSNSSSSCYVALPFDSSSTSRSVTPDSLIWGCFNDSEAKVKCNETQRYNCCSSGDKCNKDLDPPSLRSNEPTTTFANCDSVSGDCQQAEENLLGSVTTIAATVTTVITVVILAIVILLILVLVMQIRILKRSNATNSEHSASHSSITTESESVPSPTSTASPHHYLHITADEPAFGDSHKCNGSKA